jgi:hypothetical protein
LRPIAFLIAFFGAGFLRATFFLTAAFFATLLFKETLVFRRATFGFWVFRAVAFFATARLALGRAVFGAGARLFAAGFEEGRRATARDVERLKLLLTALISKVMIERAMWT